MTVVKQRKHWLLAGIAGAALVPTAAAAQQTAGNAPAAAVTRDADAGSADIVVTANKREERIRDVALSISAVSGVELERLHVQDIQDLARQVPGISFIRSGSIAGNGNNIILRGLNTGSGGATVASAIDDAPLSFSVGPGSAGFATDFEPWDLQRVEVLRGPQGSLYGASAMGGLIKYVTNAPDPTRLRAGYDVGTFELRHAGPGASARAYVNVPLAQDTVALRVSGYYQYNPGWIDNQLGNRVATNRFNRYGGRASLLIKPNAALTIRATALYQKLDSDGFDAVEVRGLTDPANQFTPIKGYNIDTFLPQPNSTTAQLYIGNITYDAGGIGVQSITSYGKLDNYRTNDVPIYQQLGYFGRPNTSLLYEINGNLTKFSQEIRLFSQNDAAAQGSGLQWQVSAFYTHETIDSLGNYYTRDTQTLQPVATPGFGPALTLQSNQQTKYREIAAYADLTYFFSPHFDIELGGRVFNNRQTQDVTQGGVFIGSPLGTVLPRQYAGETSFTFAASPRFHLNRDVMVYGRVASGYRPGGPQSYVPGAPAGLPTQYDADKTINYEVGLKGTFAGGLFTADVAAFYVDWSKVQITVAYPLGGIAYNVTGNAGAAVSKGFEWTFGLRPVQGLSITWLGAYTHATLTRDAPGIGGFKGDRLPYVPDFTTTVNATYEFRLGDDSRLSIGGSWSHQSRQFSSYTLTRSLSHLRFPGYDTWAAQIGWRQGPIGIQLYGKNLGDTRGITYYYAGQSVLGGTIPAQTGLIRPREVGIRLTGNF